MAAAALLFWTRAVRPWLSLTVPKIAKPRRVRLNRLATTRLRDRQNGRPRSEVQSRARRAQPQIAVIAAVHSHQRKPAVAAWAGAFLEAAVVDFLVLIPNDLEQLIATGHRLLGVV